MKNIFIVDDDAMFTMFMEDHLKSDGYSKISSFTTGEACLEHLDENPDVILLDYNLDANVPGAKNGKQILEEIRGINKAVSVIMISAQEIYRDQDSDGDDALHYIVKGNQAFKEISGIIEGV